jgi:hypothetical protein
MRRTAVLLVFALGCNRAVPKTAATPEPCTKERSVVVWNRTGAPIDVYYSLTGFKEPKILAASVEAGSTKLGIPFDTGGPLFIRFHRIGMEGDQGPWLRDDNGRTLGYDVTCPR